MIAVSGRLCVYQVCRHCFDCMKEEETPCIEEERPSPDGRMRRV
jgi:hypothetical protein